MNRVVITGIGIISCLGNNKKEVLASLLNSKSGLTLNSEYIENGEFLKIKEVLETSGSFKKARDERQVAINRCIEYTERFIKLDKLDEIKMFINNILVA